MILWVSMGTGIAVVIASILLGLLLVRRKRKRNYTKVKVMSGKTAVQDENVGNVDILEFDDKNQLTMMLKEQQHGLWVSFTDNHDHSRQYGFFLNDFVVVGREEAHNRKNLCILDQKLSRRHCRFVTKNGDDVWLEDLDSTNHTYVNGVQIRKITALYPGDRIVFGSSEYTFQSERV